MADSTDAIKLTIQRLLIDLASADPQTRINAILALTRVGKPAVPPLLEVLRASESEDSRWYAAYVLGLIGDPTAIPDLIKALDDSEFVAQSARRALKIIGTPEALIAIDVWNRGRVFKRR
jgi:HEAT repeat protein